MKTGSQINYAIENWKILKAESQRTKDKKNYLKSFLPFKYRRHLDAKTQKKKKMQKTIIFCEKIAKRQYKQNKLQIFVHLL